MRIEHKIRIINLFLVFITPMLYIGCLRLDVERNEVQLNQNNRINKASSTDWSELAKSNSQYESVKNNEEKELVWGIVQARIFVNGSKCSGVGGFMGTAWIVRIDEHNITFVTAAHVIQDAFHSKKDQPDKIYVFLSHSSGVSFPISRTDIEFKCQDVAFVNVSKTMDVKQPALERNLEWTNLKGKKVYNLGFPDRAQKDVHFKINIEPPSATFDKGPWRQAGRISDTRNTIIKSPDVNIKDAKCIVLDYTSEDGFSGGPLILDNHQIVGMMSMVLPTKDGSPPTQCLAIHISEILSLLSEL